jgi:beta-N-acetylhexosaminidase
LDAIMLAHIEFPHIDPVYPASLSPHIVTRLLRGQLGFDHHPVLTDDLDMGAITRRYGRGEDARLAIAAGCDLALICHETDSADQAASAIATLPSWQLDEALERIAHLRNKLSDPPVWSDQLWEKTHTKMSGLALRFSADLDSPASSPVQEY